MNNGDIKISKKRYGIIFFIYLYRETDAMVNNNIMKTITNIQLQTNQMFHLWATMMNSVLCAVVFGGNDYSIVREPKQLNCDFEW